MAGYWIFNREEEVEALAYYLAQEEGISLVEAHLRINPEGVDDGREYLNDPIEGPERVKAILAHNPLMLIWVEEDDG